MALWLVAAGFAADENPPRAIRVADHPAADPQLHDEKIVSRSKQFKISGGEGQMRGMVALLAEETKDELLDLAGEKDEWKVPVSIVLHGKAGENPPARTFSTRLLVVGGARELRLDKHLGPGLEQERFKSVLTTMLLYERALRVLHEVDSERPLRVPPWVSDGLREAVAWRHHQSDRRLYAALFKQGGVFKIDDLFATSDQDFENFDGATRAAFRVSSGALVMALLEQPQGKEGFRAFLSDVAAHEGEMPVLLRRHFPELNLSATSLAKWWALQLAEKGGLSMLTDIYTISQTEAALAEALCLHVRGEGGIFQQKELSAWSEVAALHETERAAAVRFAEDALVRLSYRCFPSYRPLLVSYQKILSDIAKNNTKGIDRRLRELQETRATMVERATRARDYLDWFEITRARSTSGAFDDYLRLKDGLKSDPCRREDDLSKYLDRMDGIFRRDSEVRTHGGARLPNPSAGSGGK